MKLKVDRWGWAWPLIGIGGSGAAIAGALTFVFGNSSVTAGGAIAFLCGAPLGLLGMSAWIHGYPYLIADVAGGTLHYLDSKTDRTSVPFAEIELDIKRGEMKSRTVSYYYDLRSPQFPDRVLFTSFHRDLVEQRQALLLNLAAQSAIRTVLATTGTGADGAFREAPELDPRLRQLVPDPQRLRTAVEALGQDPDPEVAMKARALATTLQRAAS